MYIYTWSKFHFYLTIRSLLSSSDPDIILHHKHSLLQNIIIIITPAKLAELGGRPLLTDTGDHELDKELAGYYRVITGYGQRTICKVETA